MQQQNKDNKSTNSRVKLTIDPVVDLAFSIALKAGPVKVIPKRKKTAPKQ